MPWSFSDLLKTIGNSSADINPSPEDTRGAPPAPQPVYINSPMDPLKNQPSFMDALANPAPEALKPALYDYTRSPQDNAASGSPLAQSLPGPAPVPMMPPQQQTPVARGPASIPQPKAEVAPSMGEAAYMAKMLREGKPAQGEAQPEQSPVDALKAAEAAKPAAQPRDLDLEDAQQRRRENLMALGMTKAANRLGSALAMQKPDENYANELTTMADLPVAELKEKRTNAKELQQQQIEREKFIMDKERFAQDVKMKNLDMEKVTLQLADTKAQQDPNSYLSRTSRDFFNNTYKAVGVNAQIPQGVSYQQMKEFDGTVTKMFDTKIRADAVKESAAARREAAAESASQKQIATLQKDLDPNSASSRTPLGQAVITKNSIDKLLPLSTTDQYGYNLPKAQLEELALGYASVLSQGRGGSSRAQVEALVPSSIRGDSNKLKEWLTNNPTGTQQQGFVKLIVDGLQRERKIADFKIKQAQLQRLNSGQYEKLKKTNPELYKQAIQSFDLEGLKAEDYKDSNLTNLGVNMTEGYSKAQEAGIKHVMDANGASREEAIAALKKEGKLK